MPLPSAPQSIWNGALIHGPRREPLEIYPAETGSMRQVIDDLVARHATPRCPRGVRRCGNDGAGLGLPMAGQTQRSRWNRSADVQTVTPSESRGRPSDVRGSSRPPSPRAGGTSPSAWLVGLAIIDFFGLVRRREECSRVAYSCWPDGA